MIDKELWFFRFSVDHASDSMFWVKSDGHFVFANESACRKLGYSKEEFLTLSAGDIDPDFRSGRLRSIIKEAFKAGPRTFRSHHIASDGTTFPVQITASPVSYGGEQLLFCLVRDISEKELAEEKLSAERQRFQALIENAPFGMAMYDKNGRYLYVNPKFTEMFGYTLADIPDRAAWLQKAYPDRQLRDSVVETLKADSAATPVGEKMSKSFPVSCKDGSIKIINFTTVKHKNGDRIVTFEDITLRRAAEDALADETERLAVTLRSIGDGVIATDRSGKIILVNAIAEQLTGWTQGEAMGQDLGEVFSIIDEQTRIACENPVEKVLRLGEVTELSDHTVLISKAGRELIVADSGAPIRDTKGQITGVVLVFRDVTEKKKIDEELQKMSKLESVGILAGGIAHDFNNILAAILGNISLARLGIGPGDEKLLKRLADAEQAVMRAKDLTYQLLTFSRGGTPIKKAMGIQKVLRESAKFALTGSGVKCQFSFAPTLFSVDIDEGQIGQVINNLVINSQQAMPDGGTIAIKAGNAVFENGAMENGVFLAPGNYVRISIRDNGTGIAPEHTGKIFDPYFTTKQKGSGLGLATSYSIIKNHDGHITVESKPGSGTTFYIYLKASEEQPGPARRAVDHGMPAVRTKVLHMDDEEMILQITKEMLENLGYEVETAADGNETIKKYVEARNSGVPFDIVILDITIPGGMGGKETILRLLEIDHGVKAIVSSGYSNDPVMAMFGQYGFAGVIAKPYRMAELNDAIKRVLYGVPQRISPDRD
jgi:two-component system, cell cycle sensor histidine kinase and response regulator CckA